MKRLTDKLSEEGLQVWRDRLSPMRVDYERSSVTFHGSDARTVWQRLAMLYESSTNLRALLGADLSDAVAAEIGACLRQGREWFRVANSGEVMARPVALYYGMVSLAAAAVLARKGAADLDEIPPRHGTRPGLRGITSISEAAVQTREAGEGKPRSLFWRFAKLLYGREPTPIETRNGTLWLSVDRDPQPFSASLRDLLARLPHIR